MSLPPVLPLLLVFSDLEPGFRQAAEAMFDLRHRLPAWIREKPGEPEFEDTIRAALTAVNVNAILEIRLHTQSQAPFPAVDLGNNGDATGEARSKDRTLTCDPGLLRDLRDVAAARFSDTPVTFALNALSDPPLGWPPARPHRQDSAKPIPRIRIAISSRLILDDQGCLRSKRAADLQARFETVLALFCKIQAWT